jgi:hypothetical protein
VNLSDATIDGYLDCASGKSGRIRFYNTQTNTDNPVFALEAFGAQIGSYLALNNGFEADGGVDFDDATIGKNLNCSDGLFTHSNSIALTMERASVKGNVLLCDGFSAEGQVNLSDATIDGYLDCASGKNGRIRFYNTQTNTDNPVFALEAYGAKIGDNVTLAHGFEADGGVDFDDATIGKNLNCSDGLFVNSNPIALTMEGASVKGNVLLCFGFIAEGQVDLSGATIGGNLVCDGGQFIESVFSYPILQGASMPPPPPPYFARNFALDADSANIEGSFRMRNISQMSGTLSFVNTHVARDFDYENVNSSANVSLDLRSAKVGTLIDDEASWPEPGNLLLDGFVYDEIGQPGPADASRVNWIQRQPAGQFRPQPYEQLATVLHKVGHEEEAVKVEIAKNQDLARHTPWLPFDYSSLCDSL